MRAETVPVARVRTWALWTCAYAVAVVLLFQGYGLALGVLEGSILDPWLAAVPVVWFDIALIGLLLFLWGLSFGGPRRTHSAPRTWFEPEYPAIRAALRSSTVRSWILGAGAAYAFVLMLLTGMIVIDPAGGAPSGASGFPFFEIFDAPLGWGPKLVWAPNPYFVLIVRPFTAAITVLLAMLAGFGIGLVAHAWRSVRPTAAQGRSAAGATAGLLVLCPACAAPPAFALFAGLFTPAAAGEAVAAGGLAIGPVMAFSTAMLLLSVVLLWAGVARASQAVPEAPPPETKGRMALRRRMADWTILLALVLAVGAFLTVLAAAPPADHGGEHGGPSEVAQAVSFPPVSIAFAIAGTGAAAVGLALGASLRPDRSRATALAVGLTLLYADGFVHWFAIPEHLAHVGAEATIAFFLAIGAIQVFAVPLAFRRENVLWWTGVALTVFLIALFAVTRFVAPPFATEPEPIEALGLLSKALEIGILTAMGVYFGRRIVPWGIRKTAVPIRS